MVGSASINVIGDRLLGNNALADLDAYASDIAFTSVQFWQGTNQDDVSQSGEVYTFAELGVAGIYVSGTVGNTQPFSGSCTRSNGSTSESGVAEVREPDRTRG